MLHQAPWQKRLDNLVENHGTCQFGLAALIAPLIAGVLPEAVATAAVPLAGIAVPEFAADVLVGAGGGAALSGLTGGNPLLGAVSGGLTGGIGAFGPALGAATGIGTVGGDILTGVAGGVLGSEITGSSPLTGALTGGAMGAISGVVSPGPVASASGGTAGTTPGQGGSAAATAVPAGGGPAAGGGGTTSAFGDIFNSPALGGTAGTAAAGMGGDIGVGGAQSTMGSIGGGPGTPGTAVSGTTGSTTAGSGAVSGTPTTATSGSPEFGTNWATPGAIQQGWSSVAAAGGSPVAPDTGGIGGFVKGIEGDLGKIISSPTALLAGGLLASQMFGSSSSSEQQTMQQLQDQAASAASTATMLQAPLRSGVLPPGAQASLDLAKSNAEASARSTYAAMGMGESTGQADAFQAIAENIAAQKVGIEDLLFSQAGPYAQLASTDYNNILNQQRAQDQQFTGALSNFVAALAGSTGGSRAVA